MTKTIQIRNVPNELPRRLKSRAVEEGMSLSDYVLGELRRIAEWPTREEIIERLERHALTDPCPPEEEAVRPERNSKRSS